MAKKVNEKLAKNLISLVADAVASNTIPEAEDYIISKYQGTDNELIEHTLTVLSKINNEQFTI
jgi:hypothetical protein